MALFDHRVFRVGSDWWAAQVHSASGAGYGTPRPRMSSERVFFSSLSDRSRNTLTARIPAGFLNRMSHRSLLGVFRGAKDLGSHFPMAAFNVPSLEELGPPVYTDDEDLRWVVHPTRAVHLEPTGPPATSEGIVFICLDDSAVRKETFLGAGLSPDTIRSDPERLAATINAIKATYIDYTPDTEEQ